MDFDPKLHQKVTYFGQDKDLRKLELFVVVKAEFPNIYSMSDDEEIVIHQINRFNQIIFNSEPKIREHYKVKRSEINFEGDLYRPNAWIK